jgi:ubiquinone/menaquinone biosynthesis C-methylase UbiE
MPPVFWTGKLSLPMKCLTNINCLLAWMTGNARDTAAMKKRMKLGYEGVCSDHVTRYDELGLQEYTKMATNLLEGVDLRDKEVLDVGCGTGILSLLAIKQGAAKLTCGDLSEYMLGQCRKKIIAQGFSEERVDFRELDAENLPYDDKSLDAVISGMLIGLVPNQEKVVTEMARVLRPKGTVAFSTHGPNYFWEVADAVFRSTPKRYVMGYRIEYWPLKETEIQRMLTQAGLVNVQTQRVTWQHGFDNGGKTYDFFAAVSAEWWNAKFPPDKREELSKKSRDYCEHNKVTQITHDVILAYGLKP